jgi:polysaccharide deacetylase 2 family uncharacterized protein YibQ
LQTLGPPAPKPVVAPPPEAAPASAPKNPPPVEAIAPKPATAKADSGQKPAPVDLLKPGRATPGPIASPDPALLDPSPRDPAVMLPRISADGRAPMAVYARGFDPSSRRPRIGLLFAGFGPNLADSEEAIRALPAGITLAFSPYSPHLKHLLDVARVSGHEFLVSIPMEPQGYPQNDAGDHALLTTVNPAVNETALYWTLGRMEGYAGGTGALGPLRGERFAAAAAPMDAMLQTLASRGLLYIDPRPGAAPLPMVWSRAVDVVVDDPPERADIDAKLAQLEKIAHDRGSALGLAEVLRPLTIGRLLAWSTALQDHGFALAPTSALVHAPPPITSTASEGH